MIRAPLALLLASLLALTACSLERPDPDKSFYTLASPQLDPSAPTADVTLRVTRARLAAPFGSRALQYRVGPDRFEADYYHNWADDPGALITAAAVDALASTEAFRAVVDDASVAGGAQVLELHVVALYVDVTDRATPTAVLRIRATLLDAGGSVLFSRAYDATAPAASPEAASAVRAWNTTLESVIKELAADLGDAPRP